ncbi:MAG: TonB family protein [Chthonomonadaceae bacterium]|nr:TonB family protein [Chthonomonadaceae bacterium]
MEHFMVELFVRGVVLCLLAAMALVLLRGSAAVYRHLICVLALCGLLVLPLVQRLLPPLPLLAPEPAANSERLPIPTTEPPRLAAVESTAEITPIPEAPQNANVQTTSATLLPPSNTPIPHSATRFLPTHPQQRFPNVAAILFAIWGLGVATLLIRLIAALFRLRGLESDSREMVMGSVPVRVSDRVVTPLTWGIHRRVILLPNALLSGDPAICESALRHEQAHIARWDWIWSLFAEIVCAICWFQPGTWWLRSRMRMESERACDDLVLLSGIAGPDYATHLLQILRSGGSSEVAPAMAQSGDMEERMRHILDTNRPRRANRIRLAFAAHCGIGLLLLAALRVSVRPAEAKPLPDRNSTGLQSGKSLLPARASQSMLPAAESGTPTMTELPFSDLPPMSVNNDLPTISNRAPMAPALPGIDAPQGNSQPAAAPVPVIPIDHVVWGKAVDGLEPGFLLNSPGAPNDRAPVNSHVYFQVLVRNTTHRECVFEVQCQNHDEMDIPYLIPSDDVVAALEARVIPAKYRALGTSSPLDGLFPGYVVKLAPGEAVVLPEGLGLYIGTAEKQSFPRIEEIKQGMNWIVQPVTIHSLTPAVLKEAETANNKISVTVVSQNGKAGQRSVMQVPALSGGKRLLAKIQIEVGTLDAEAVRNTDKAVWGKVEKGMQCGIRLLTPRRAFHVGDTLEAELLWRYTGNTPISAPLPRQLDLYPSIQDAAGHTLQIDFGGRFDLLPDWHTFEAGEVHSLGVTAITLVPSGTPSPKSNMESGHITLAPGVYKLSGWGGVGDPNPESGAIEFQVVVADADTPQGDGIAWGVEQSGLRLGLRLPRGVTSFTKLSQARFEVLLTNRSGKRTHCTWMGYPTINQFSPELFTPGRKPVPYIKTIAGPYMEHETILAAGETVVLGTISLPQEEARKLDALPGGIYRAEFELEVTLPDHTKASLKSQQLARVGIFL